MKGHIITALLAVLGPVGLHAQQMQHMEDEIHRHLFPPEAVMQHQRELGITPQQRTSITELVRELQHDVVDLQWQLQTENQQLVDLVERSPVDADAAVAQFERVLDVERRIKTAHLRTLIRLRNLLTPEQQGTLRELLDAHRDMGMGSPMMQHQGNTMHHEGETYREGGAGR